MINPLKKYRKKRKKGKARYKKLKIRRYIPRIELKADLGKAISETGKGLAEGFAGAGKSIRKLMPKKDALEGLGIKEI